MTIDLGLVFMILMVCEAIKELYVQITKTIDGATMTIRNEQNYLQQTRAATHTHTDRRASQQQQQDDGVELENERRHKTEDYI